MTNGLVIVGHTNIARVARSGETMLVQYMDNMPAMWALRRGHSGNRIADVWIRRFYESLPSWFRFFLTYVPTDANTSDSFSRWRAGMLGDFMKVNG